MRSSAHRLCPVLASVVATLLLGVTGASLDGAEAAEPAPGGAAPAPQAPQPARWTQKKISFTYLGFTTHYSCEGLLDKVRMVLLQLGARRSDMHVHEAGCTARLGEPTPFPAVAGTFSVLEPVPPAQAYSPNGAGGIVFAHWQPVSVRFDHSDLDMSGQCELLEQVRQHILPLFPARNVQFQSLCIPHQLTVGGNSLRVEVLIPETEKASSTRNDAGPAGRASEPVQAANR
ncbi:MAG TPA: hypothetical protein VMD03_05220 [Steroidobacteraceae bacterium]|nr:hypothetical protein [Steroidobacteraceae bacterium]